MMGQHIFGNDLTAKALETCKKTVLHPYLAFLKVVSSCNQISTAPEFIEGRGMIIMKEEGPNDYECSKMVPGVEASHH